jgi:hypothetical protein
MPINNPRSAKPEISAKNEKTLPKNQITMPLQISSTVKIDAQNILPKSLIPDSPPLSPTSLESQCIVEIEPTISGISNAFEKLNINMSSKNYETKINIKSSNPGILNQIDDFCAIFKTKLKISDKTDPPKKKKPACIVQAYTEIYNRRYYYSHSQY